MTAPRRETDRNTADALGRLWQVYADEVGLPKAEVAQEPIPETSEPPAPRRPRAALIPIGISRPVAAVAVVVVAVIGGVALWRGSSTAPPTAQRPASSPAPQPATADRAGRSPAQEKPARDAAQAPAPPVPVRAAPPSATVTKPEATAKVATPPREGKAGRAESVEQIQFDLGSDRINDESRPALDKVVGAMKANVDWRMVIEGHTDAQGGADDNRALSERRAQAVKSYLQSAGIAPARLTAVGFGASRPVAPNDPRGHALNRRVELRRR